MKFLARFLSAMALAAVLAAPAVAQDVAIADNYPVAGARDGGLLDVPARLTVHDLSLPAALTTLQKESGVRVAFSPSFIEGHVVSCECQDVSVGEALRQLLLRTDLRFTALGGQVLVEPAPESNLPWGARPVVLASTRSGLGGTGNGGSARRAGGQSWAAAAATIDRPSRVELQGTVQGRVTEARTGRPLRSVQVTVDGTNQGVLTNADGGYRLASVGPGEVTLRAQSIGYAAAEQVVNVASGATVTVDFQLAEQTLALDEIIVTGTAGQARRREIGNTITQISSRELEEMPIRDLGDVLQARVAGGVISDATGQVGAGRTIRLRGANSLTMANSPLIYVDGVRINSEPFNAAPGVNNAASPLSSLNPADIERVEIIKGAAASTLYGTEASSGVIQIFTKRGARGEPVWQMGVSQGVNNMGHVGPKEDPTGLWFNDCSMFDGCPSRGSWLRNGHIQRYNLSVQGGNDDLVYFLSGRLGNEQGVLDLQHQNDWALRGNFGFDATPTLNVQFTSGYSNRSVRWLEEGNNAQSMVINIIRGPAGLSPNADHSYHLDREVWTFVDHLTTGLNVLWTPGTRTTHRLNAGLDLAMSESSRERPWGDPLFSDGDRSVNSQDRRRLSLDYAGTLSLSVNDDISSSTSWGSQLFERFDKGVNGYGRDFAGPGGKVIGSGAVTSSSENSIRMISGGVFLEQMFGWQDRLFVTAGVRWDGFSTFGEGLGMVAYPKVSAAYTLSDHEWWPATVESFKLRAAMGESGRAPGAFDAVRVWGSVAGDDGRPGVTPSNPGNPDLGPERTREFEYGFEGSAYENFLTFEFTGYNQRTYDALIAMNQVPSLGYAGTQLENVGELKAWGSEASVSLRPIRRPSVEWELGFRYAYTMTEAVDLGGLEQIAAFVPLWQQWIMPGHPIPVYMGPIVQNPDAVGVPPVYEDEVLGGAYPPHSAGINTSLTLGQRITLSGLGEFQGGHYLTNGMARQQVRRGLWPACIGVRERVLVGDIEGLTARQQDQCQNNPPYIAWTQRGDFFKLRQVSLSYNIPERFLWAGATRGNLRIAANNLMTITNYDGLDPESIQGGSLEGSSGLYRVEYYQLPPARRFLVSLNLNF